MLGSLQSAFAPAPVAAARRTHAVRTYAAAQTSQGGAKEQIYVGKGRFIEDAPEKYPDRTTLTGGFAGGEVGLKQFVSEVAKPKQPAAAAAAAAPTKAPKPGKGLYVGKGKFVPDDSASNEARVMRDTGRDALVGGFTGGELGLRSYLDSGEVPFLPQGAQPRRQQSPLIVAGTLAAGAVVGGLLLTDASDLGERALSGSTPVSPAALAGLDENTKLLLETAVLLVGVLGTAVAGRAVVASLTSSLKDSAARLGTLAVFWLLVFVAAKIVLDG